MFVGYRYGAKMSAAEATEFPDLDTLINAAENRSGESSGEGNNSDKGAFDPDEYAGFVKWYSEQSKNLQRHYEVHLEHQKQKLAEENEAGLLEALQQSLKNFESDHMSDFASISSLDNACSYLTPNSVSGTDSGNDGTDKQSMLKELLLSPLSENYSREIDSPEHASSDLNTFGNSSPESLSPASIAADKLKSGKKLKPFVELLKHMEASETLPKKTKPLGNLKSKQSGTRLVNTKRYMSKYATANPNKKESAPHKLDLKSLQKRIVLHPVKNGTPNCKTITLSLKPNSASKFVNRKAVTTIGNSSFRTNSGSTSPKNAPIFSTSVTTLKTVTITSQKLAEKRAATPTTDQLPQKKLCTSPTTSAGQSIDHDYCTTHSCKSPHTVGKSAETKTDENFTPPESPKSQAKSASQKVLKWQDYLQQVRAGVRSAPNSPTTSPKVIRGSARPSNNFMIVSLQGNQATPEILVNTMAGKGKISGKVPIPEALRKTAVKQNFGLQEFDKYMKGLENNMNLSSDNAKINPNVTVTIAANDVPTSKPDSISSSSFSAAHSLAALAQQQQQSEISSEKEKASNKTLQVPKSQNVPQKDMKKQQKLVPVSSGNSGQLLMIKVPVSSTSAQRSSKKIMSPTASALTPNTLAKPVPVVVSNPKPQASSTSPVPTFKLMTSNKDGAESKSLILSGVTGKLKDILTLMAEQQAKCRAENVKPETMSSEQQLNTLQKLISCLSSQQNLKVDPPTNSDSLKPEMESNDVSSHTSENTSTTSTDLTRNSVSMEVMEAVDSENHAILPVSVNPAVAEGELPSTENKVVQNEHGGDCSQGSIVNADSSDCDKEVDVEKEVTTDITLQATVSDVAMTLTEQIEPDKTALQSADGSSEIFNSSRPDFEMRSETPDSARKFSMTRSMAAAEMMASDVIDDGTQEIMVYGNQGVKTENTDRNNNLVGDSDPAVITLGEAMEALEDDEILNQDHQQQTSSLTAADGLFCKLPSYFLTGKLMLEGGKQEENMEGLKKRGMKNVGHDPLISSKGNDVEFNKLPHYMSSGKFSRQSSPTPNRGKSHTTKQNVNENKDYAVKFNRVGDSQHLTPQGTPVNTSETYFSKLPSYYTYGRPHPPVKTFNDAVAYAKDDTVTSEMIVADKHEKHKRSSKRKHKAKKKRKKHNRSSKKDESSEKVLYSKLPSYYLSGRVLSTHEKDRSVRISPPRSYSVRSPSPRSLSYSSRSSLSRSRSRSPLRRSNSRRRHSSRSYSRSSSSGSEGESRRSWRLERRSTRSRRGVSHDRRSYDSSDEDRDEYLWRRERDARRARKQHQDVHEKERQRAMEERRVIYVGGIDKKMTKQELRRKFLRFGNIEAVSLHFRDDGDDYGFLTFQYTSDAFRAIEEGRNLGPGEPRYDLSFGGRRQFCKAAYQDLDSKVTEEDAKRDALDDFDALLQQAKRSLRR